MNPLPEFTAPKLAAAIAMLSPEQINSLPFGVIALDQEGLVRFFSKTEATLSGYRSRPAFGRMFFTDVAPCMDNGTFKGRIDKARQAGPIDICFSFIGDFNDPERELTVRVQSAKDGGIWIFIQRSLASKAVVITPKHVLPVEDEAVSAPVQMNTAV
jgi:photoactive yellow protein